MTVRTPVRHVQFDGPPPSTQSAVRDTFLPEVQALRALAVGLVLVYHVAPLRLTGGFIGVDVFFVISGFLITGHLTRELDRAGTVQLGRFYARRARRLLPASLLVLAATAAATVAVVPQNLWSDVGRQIVASAFYVQNWVLARDAVDYFATGAHTSPVQHFWSLSVEEQFYLVWPLLLLGASTVGRRSRWGARAGLWVGLTAVALLSLVVSVATTSADPDTAYFLTPARAWEFAAGGLLSLSGLAGTGPLAARVVASWAGLVTITVSAVLISDASPFPGWLALLPVLGTVAVIAAGDVRSPLSTRHLTRLWPVQFLGAISYSVYLWHWPLIVLLPFVLPGAPGTLERLAVLPASVALAWVTTVTVEERFRRPPPAHGWPATHRRVAAGAVAGMLAVSAPALALVQVADARTEQARAELAAVRAAPPPCFGAAALLDPACTGRATSGEVVPDPVIAGEDGFSLTVGTRDCQVDDASLRACAFGSTEPGAPRVALVGDSHAGQWHPALVEIAESSGWALTTYVKSGCPLSTVRPELGPRLNDGCTAWSEALLERLTAEEHDLVVVSALASSEYPDQAGTPGAERAATGMAEAWTRLRESGSQVVALRDSPHPPSAGTSDVPSCVAEHEDRPEACALDESEALPADPQARAARSAGVPLLDLTPAFCRDGVCPAVIGGVLVYRDKDHVTATYARTLAPFLASRLEAAGLGALVT